MPQYSHVNLLLPCHSLEDFPTHHVGDIAEGLLANWTARWHPQIIAATGCRPQWSRIDELGKLEGAVVLLPAASRDELLYDYPEQGVSDLEEKCTKAGAILLTDRVNRGELAAELTGHIVPSGATEVDDDLVRDFYALGYWHLQIELLTRQMRYASHLDDGAFGNAVVEAATLAASGSADGDSVREKLQYCFTMLADERNHYYPVDAYLLPLAMIAPTSRPEDVQQELALLDDKLEMRTNLWCTGATATKIKEEQPGLAENIASKIESVDAQLVGCEFSESPILLDSPEAWLADVRRGLDAYASAFGSRPTTYFRRAFGLNPALPPLLTLTGWQNVVHATLDAGQFPTMPQSRTSWEGANVVSIHAFGNVPVDASRPETFLKLALTMGQSMERDYVAAVCLAHWCGKASRWLDEVRRGQRYNLGIGSLSRFEDFFASTEFSLQVSAPEIDKYHSPWLAAEVTAGRADPVSQHVKQWNADANRQTVNGLATWAAVLGVGKDEITNLHEDHSPLRKRGTDSQVEPDDIPRLRNGLGLLVARRLLARGADDQPLGRLLLNLENAPMFDTVTGKKIPACGYLWVPKSGATLATSSNQDAIVTDGSTMANQFLSLKIDPDSGAIRSIYDNVTRGNRLSQRLAYVDVDSASDVTEMRCDNLEVVSNDANIGVIRATGRLVDSGDENMKLLANFSQQITLRQRSRMVELEMEIQPQVELSDKAWRNYFACRWAWASSDATLCRSILGGRFESNAKRCEAPLNLEIVESRRHTTILSGGIPFHHQCGERMLDSILLVRGESCRNFRMGIGIELPSPQQAAYTFAGESGANASERSGGALVEIGSRRPDTDSGCLFHINSPHVLATGWEPVWSDDSAGIVECAGFRVRLKETSGKSGCVKLSAPRRLGSAAKCDLVGTALQSVQVANGVAEISLSANEWTEVECRW